MWALVPAPASSTRGEGRPRACRGVRGLSLSSTIATAHPQKRLASGGAHASHKHGKAARKTTKHVGSIQIFLRAGSILSVPKGPLPSSYVNACSQAPGGPQVFQVTFTLLDG